MQSDFPMMKETSKEIRSGNDNTSFNERLKQNNLIVTFVRSIFTFDRAPLDNGPRLEKTVFHKGRNGRFRQLTFSPP